MIPEEPKTSPSIRNTVLESMQKKKRQVVAEVKRVPVDFRYDAVNPHFLKMLAKIGSYASEKYGAFDQYTQARLTGDKSPINHIFEHLRQYQCGEQYDHFDGDPRWHLAAVAYNAMMAFFYHTKFGPEEHPLAVNGAKMPGDSPT